MFLLLINALFKNIYLFYYAYNILSVCMPEGQKRAPDPITDGCELPCGCWELNSGPLEEQAILLTSEPSLQPLFSFFRDRVSLYIPVCPETHLVDQTGLKLTDLPPLPLQNWG